MSRHTKKICRPAKESLYRQFIVVKCTPLDDQWECDANRVLCFISNSFDYAIQYVETAKMKCYEIWGVKQNGNIEILEEYDDLW